MTTNPLKGRDTVCSLSSERRVEQGILFPGNRWLVLSSIGGEQHNHHCQQDLSITPPMEECMLMVLYRRALTTPSSGKGRGGVL